jgi:hypothetical protein
MSPAIQGDQTMAPLVRTLTHPTGAARVEAVLEALRAFTPFADLHPWITRVEVLPAASDGSARFRVHESLRLFGFIPQRPVYEAVVSSDGPGIVTWTARIRDRLDLAIRWSAESETAIEERIELAPGGLAARVFARILERAHVPTIGRLAATL